MPGADGDSPEVLARVREGLDLVDIIARQIRRCCGAWVEEEELVAHGREALLTAARSYDPERGATFRRWANLRVRGAMIELLRTQSYIPKNAYRKLRAIQAADRVHEAAAEETGAPPSPEAADAQIGDRLASAAMAMALSFLKIQRGEAIDDARDPRESPEAAVARAELAAKIRAAIAERPEAERRLLQRHYFDDVTMEEAGRELGLSKSWTSRLHARALEGVARSIKKQKLAG
ncbi:MAG: sigma-70 family RNA polymerase sigma factor [Labilithrix sp.]|nr:sigma-70 family RNA polymerase sigma factor [Labilithrix sp.]